MSSVKRNFRSSIRLTSKKSDVLGFGVVLLLSTVDINPFVPDSIINELRSKLECKKEDCWLKQLNEKERKSIDESVFAPDHPDKWKDNPTEWLSNYDILSVSF